MQDLSGSSRWYYDKEGRIVKLEKTIDSNTYKLEWIYDAMGRIKSILFPNLKKVDFTYNNAGLTESINGYILNVDYNASNQPTQIIFSNSMTTRFDYYPENYRLKSILTGSLQDLSYEYDKVGNVTKITDSVHSFTKNYFYDDLDRLISGDGNTYEYNAIGNILKVNGITQNYSSSKIHALINDGTNSYSYDSCGNMVSGAGRIISYDPENRPIKIIKDGIITQFVYDGDGKRVKKIVTNGSSAITTIYIEDLFEKEITNF
jgi:YD repeat-containing protein